MRQSRWIDDDQIRRKRTPSFPFHESIVTRNAQERRWWIIISTFLCRWRFCWNCFSRNYFCKSVQYRRSSLRFVWRIQSLPCENRETCFGRTIWPIVCADKFVDDNTYTFDRWSCARRSIAKVPRTSGKATTTKSCDTDLCWCTNGIVERAVRRVTEGTSAVLLQSGLDEKWWADSMECKTYLRNIQDLLSDGKTPYERRFGKPLKRTDHSVWFTGWVSPFYCEGPVKKPSILKESLTWIVVGYALYAGWTWKGDALVADCKPWGVGDDGRIGNLLKKDSMRTRWYFPKKRVIYFPSQMDESNPWRRSRPENIHLDTAATNSRRKPHGFSRRIRRVSSTTSRLTSGCRWSDKWFFVHVRELHFPPSRWTQSQASIAERTIIHHSTEVHWRFQNNTYEFGCRTRKPHRWLLEHRWIKRFAWFLDRFHTIYSFGRKSSRRIYVVWREIKKKTAYIQARLFMARTLDEIGKKCQAEGEAKVVTCILEASESTRLRLGESLPNHHEDHIAGI